MKQYTNESQTAKLIELGFDKPKFEIETQMCNVKGQPLRVATIVGDYSIGELISFLPDDGVSNKRLEFDCFHWIVDWDYFDKIHQTIQVELVDALYDMAVELKEEGMIIRINREEKRVILDSGSTQEPFWYDTLSYSSTEIVVKRNNETFMVIPYNYGIIIYEDAE